MCQIIGIKQRRIEGINRSGTNVSDYRNKAESNQCVGLTEQSEVRTMIRIVFYKNDSHLVFTKRSRTKVLDCRNKAESTLQLEQHERNILQRNLTAIFHTDILQHKASVLKQKNSQMY